jgi:methyl coenzyme M reductase alpha subunit
VTATVQNAVTGSNGATIPAGATVNMTVTALKRSENSNDKIVMEFAVNSVSFNGRTYPIEATVTSAAVNRVKDQPTDKTVQKVGIGAAVGAIAGRIIGGSTKATVIGGAAGAAAGAATAAATANYQGCIDAGGSIVLTLTAPATVKA